MTMTGNHVHEPDDSDVRHVAGRHLHAARGHAWGHPGRVSQPPADPATPVTLDDPASQDAHQEILDAVQRAVAAVPELRFPIDVTFPGENEPDQVDAWISACAEPFYIRA